MDHRLAGDHVSGRAQALVATCLPVCSVMQRVCDPGPEDAWTVQGIMARAQACHALPSVSARRLRPAARLAIRGLVPNSIFPLADQRRSRRLSRLDAPNGIGISGSPGMEPVPKSGMMGNTGSRPNCALSVLWYTFRSRLRFVNRICID